MVKISLLLHLVLRRVVILRSRWVRPKWPCPPLQVPPPLLLMPYVSRPSYLRLNPVLALLLFHQTLSSRSKPAASFPFQQPSTPRLQSQLLCFGDIRVRTHQRILELCLPERVASNPKEHALRNLIDFLAYICARLFWQELPRGCQCGKLKKARHNHPSWIASAFSLKLLGSVSPLRAMSSTQNRN